MIKVLYEDKYLIVVEKPVNILSETVSNTRRTMPDILKKMTGAYAVDTVHRLDKMVGGTMVYSKSRRATAGLSKMIRDHEMVKEYLAVIHGVMDEPKATLRDILFKDSKKNKSFVVKTLRKGAKEASLDYEMLATAKTEKGEFSLVKVRLHTGRTHQIRVQFASRQHPLVGDSKYGSPLKDEEIALWSYHLQFQHPVTGKPVDEVSFPKSTVFPFSCFMKTIREIEKQHRAEKEML